MTKYCPGGSYLALKIKSAVPVDRTLIAIGYNQNTQKVLYLLATEDSGRTNNYITYL